MNLRKKALVNHILPDTHFKPKHKNKKSFLHSIKIIIRSSLLYYYFYACVQELFPVLWKTFHKINLSWFIQNISLSLDLNPHFKSSICCKSHILSVRPQRPETDSGGGAEEHVHPSPLPFFTITCFFCLFVCCFFFAITLKNYKLCN